MRLMKRPLDNWNCSNFTGNEHNRGKAQMTTQYNHASIDEKELSVATTQI